MSIAILRAVPFFLFSSLALTASAQQYKHVLVLSLDGLHYDDIADPAIAPYIPDVLDLAHHGVTYSNAYSVKPTDNFPNVVAQFTGAGPRTAGIYYDNTWRRDYYPSFAPEGTPPGTTADWTADIDYNSDLINGGGNSDSSSINPLILPQKLVNGQLVRVYPHDDLKVNTAFEVAHAAGLRTAYIDKHPAYDIVKGPSGQGLDDFYAPESDAKAILVNGELKDGTNAPPGSKLKSISKSIPMSEAYDDLRVDALVNQINGKTSAGAPAPGAPALFGMSFIAINTAEKDPSTGGLDSSADGTIVNPGLGEALMRTNASVNRVVAALKAANLYDSTLIVLTAKHGQSPRVGTSTVYPGDLVSGTLAPAGIEVKQTTDDDVSLVWLGNAEQTGQAKDTLLQQHGDIIDKILTGADIVAAGLGDPSTDPRTPDLIVEYKPGILLSSSNKRSEHGGFSDDDSHIALILGGAIPDSLQGTFQDGNVLDTQLAPTMLQALGLDPNLLDGVRLDGTQVLPGAFTPEPSTTLFLLPLTATLFSRRRRHQH